MCTNSCRQKNKEELFVPSLLFCCQWMDFSCHHDFCFFVVLFCWSMNGLFVQSLLFFVGQWMNFSCNHDFIYIFLFLSMNELFVQSWLFCCFFCVFCTNNWLFVKSWPCGFCFFCQCMNFSCNLDIFFVFLSKKELFVQSWLSFLFGQWMHFSCYHFFLLFYVDGQWMNFSCNHYFFLRMHELFVQSWFCVFCFSAKRASIWNK